MAEKKFRLSVGYRNSSDVELLREALAHTDIALVSYDQNAQRVFDNSVRRQIAKATARRSSRICSSIASARSR